MNDNDNGEPWSVPKFFNRECKNPFFLMLCLFIPSHLLTGEVWRVWPCVSAFGVSNGCKQLHTQKRERKQPLDIFRHEFKINGSTSYQILMLVC